jgi:hypothetical protein
MKTGAIALIVVGGLLILGPIVAHTYTDNRDRDRVVEFYRSRGSAEILPDSVRPSAYSAYDWACFVAGAVLVVFGVRQVRGREATAAA